MIIRTGTRALLAIASLVTAPSFADELNWTHYGTRPLAMGNAFVSVADDYNALFYNPAGLARLDTWHLELINPSFAVSKNTVATAQDVSNLMQGNSASSVQATLDVFETLTGKPQYVNVGWTPHLIFPNFGFGVGVDIGGSVVVHRQISADLDAGVRATIPVAYARNFFEDRLSIGMAIKGLIKSGVEREFSLADISAFTKKDATDSTGKQLKDYVVGGTAIGVDAGLLFTPVKTMEPTLGISVADIGGTPFKERSINGETFGKPKPREPALNAGFSMKPVKTENHYLLTTIESHAINQPIHYSKKFNLGAEYGLGKVLKLEAGLHQGELSGGFQLDAWLLILRFATYAEQVGTVAGDDALHSDRRYVAQFKLLI